MFPWLATRKTVVGAGGIGSRMTADDELTNHARNAKQENEKNIDDNERGTTVLTCHERETPHVAKTYGRSCRGKYKTYF